MVLLSIEIVFRQSRSEISELDQLGDGGSEGSDSEASGCTVASPSPPCNFGNWFWGIYFKDTPENQNVDALSPNSIIFLGQSEQETEVSKVVRKQSTIFQCWAYFEVLKVSKFPKVV